MTDAALIASLADRCEVATGPDRKLDAAIAVAIKLDTKGVTADDHEYLSLARADDQCAPGTYWFHCRSGMSLRTAPTYTASIDAAMTLVPEGAYPTLDFVAGRCWLRTAEGYDLPTGVAYGCGVTVPLAICAAALRVRALDRSGGGRVTMTDYVIGLYHRPAYMAGREACATGKHLILPEEFVSQREAWTLGWNDERRDADEREPT